MQPYYYSILNAQEQSNYLQLYNGVCAMQGEIVIDNPVDVDRFFEIVRLFALDYPDIAYFNRMKGRYLVTGGQTKYIPEYWGDQAKNMEIQKAFYEQCSMIVNRVIKPEMSDFEKEVALHDFLTRNINFGYYEDETIAPDMAQSAYCTLQHRKGVCAAYAALFKCLTNMAGLDCIVVHGYRGEAPEGPNGENHRHAWNIIKIDNGYAHVDVTHDESLMCGHDDHTKINFTDELAKRDTYHWDEPMFPLCNRPDLSYFYQRGLYVGSEKQLIALLNRMKKKKVPAFSFQVGEELADWKGSKISNRVVNTLNEWIVYFYHEPHRVFHVKITRETKK